MESPRPLEVKGELEFLLRLKKSVGLITTCLRPIMVQELKEGEKQYKRWKKRRWRRRRRGVLRRRLRLALARSGEGFFAEQRCQSNFISPFLSKAFFRSFVEPQAIFCREESPAAWWQRMREKSMLSSPLLYNQLHRYTIHIELELKIQIRNTIFAQICLNWKKKKIKSKIALLVQWSREIFVQQNLSGLFEKPLNAIIC